MSLTLLTIAIAGSLASLGIRRVPVAASATRFHWNPFHEIAEGARVLHSQKPLALAVFGLSLFWFVGALFQLALLLAGTEVLHVSETHVGLLVTALAIGIGLGSIMAGVFSGDHIELGLIPPGAALMGISSIAAGLSTSYAFWIGCLIVIGFGGGLVAVPLNAFLQEKAAITERGRILATNNFANMLGVILASATLWLTHDVFRWNPGLILGALGAAMLAGSFYLVRRMAEDVVRFALLCLVTLLFRVRVEGGENIPATGPVLLVSNHVSYADSVLVGYAARRRKLRFIMWQPIFDIPVANLFFRVLRTIPIDEESPRHTISALRIARAELSRGEAVMIFPEGSISHSGETRDFKRGFEKILQGSHAPIVPIHTSGLYGHPLSCKGGGPFRSWENFWRPVVTVRVGKPIHASIEASELRQAVLSA